MELKIKKLAKLSAVYLCVWAGTASAGNFPDRPVKVIMPFPPGVGPDVIMRQVGERLSAKWNQQVIVENRSGGNGWIAAEAVKRSKPDGYTLLLVNSPLLSLHPHLYSKLPFNPDADFDPVAAVYKTYFLVTTAKNAKWNTINELAAEAKAHPGQYTYGTSGYGSDMHVGGSMLQNAVGAEWNHIPYKETAQIYVDMTRGDVGWAFGSIATTAPLYAADKIKYLAIAAPERAKQLPDIPTLHEKLGDKGFDLQTSIFLVAPRDTPSKVIEQINTAVGEVLKEKEILASMEIRGVEALTQTPEQLGNSIKKESEQYAEILQKMKISLD